MFRRHYSDEQLLAHLDGELANWTRRWMGSHLKTCWLCRTRQAELEQQIQAVSAALDEPNFPRAGWAEESVGRFRRWQAAQDGSGTSMEALPAARRWLPVPALAAAAIVLIVAGAEWWWMPHSRAVPDQRAVIAAARNAESVLAAKSYHQSFRVEISQARPARTRRLSNLEIWSEPQAERYALRWTEAQTLRYAAWRPEHGREYVHGAAAIVEQQAAHLMPDAGSDADPAELERLLARWLDSRKWQPVSIGDEVAHFVSQDGINARVERQSLPDGKSVLRLTAHHSKGGSDAELTVDFGETDALVRVYRMRLSSAARVIEVSLTAQRNENVPDAQIRPAVFEPDWRFIELQPGPATGIAPLEPNFSAAPAPAAELPTEEEMLEREVEALYALHRLDVCLGEPVQLSRQSQGRILLSGLIESAQRKEEILRSVQDLPYVAVEVRTVGEELHVSAAPEVSPTANMPGGPSNPGVQSQAAAPGASRALLQKDCAGNGDPAADRHARQPFDQPDRRSSGARLGTAAPRRGLSGRAHSQTAPAQPLDPRRHYGGTPRCHSGTLRQRGGSPATGSRYGAGCLPAHCRAAGVLRRSAGSRLAPS